MRKLPLIALVLMLPAPSHAQQQMFNISVGYFAVRTEDARAPGDVLVGNRDFLAFNINDFSNAALNGEWLVGIGDKLEVGTGLGYYRRTVPSVYAATVSSTGAEIEQALKLRIIPLTAVVRVLPRGGRAGVQPFLGVGVGLYRWRYSETGEFVDFGQAGWPIFHATYAGEGTSLGPIFLGGARVPVGDAFTVGGELRYQKAEGDLDATQFYGS
ncbi:MAG: outer membrane beta-barrel protein, partial [Acidobacteria bacterium]|nr:outer membrane beta-barrel protein [Acidobacteriota bacterium]